MFAGSPLKQAIGAEVTLVKPGGRIHRPAKRYRFFRLLSENRPERRKRTGRSNAENPADDRKENQACGD
jgi:hypothetical protein